MLRVVADFNLLARVHRAAVRLTLVACVAAGSLSCGKKDLDGPACARRGDTGSEEGELIQDFSLRDQNNNEVRLSDYCGDVVVIQMGAMWCPSCQNEARKIPELMDKYGDQGFIVLDLMAETTSGASPGVNDLKAWADNFDLTTPVLADTDWEIWERYFDTHSTPGALLIDRDGRIVVGSWIVTETQIQAEL